MTFLTFLRTRALSELSYAVTFGFITFFALLATMVSSSYKWQLSLLNFCIAAFALLQLLRELNYLYDLYLAEKQLKKDDPQ